MKGAIQKVKDRLKRKKLVSAPKLALQLDILERNVCRILKDDLYFKPYQKIGQPLITDAHRAKRVQFANWTPNNSHKVDTTRILFSDEKMFDIDSVYNAQNKRVRVVDRATANINNSKGGKRKKRKFPRKSWSRLGFVLRTWHL